MTCLRGVWAACLLGVVLGGAACGDSGDDGAGSGGSGGSGGGGTACTAMIDGTPFEGEADQSFWTMNHGGVSVTCGNVAGATGITLNLGPTVNGPGEFALDGSTISLGQYVQGALHAMPGAWASTSGTAKITVFGGDVIEGTFSFEGEDDATSTTKTVSAGSFRVPMQ